MKIEVNLEKRYAYLIIGLLILVFGFFVVNALTPGVAPNPGHIIDNVAPPSECADGQVLQFTDSVNGWGCVDMAEDGVWTQSGSNIYYNEGNVGIGTTSPASKLEVAGIIHSTSGGIKFPDNTVQTTAGYFKAGSYVGNGVDNREITGVGFQPDYVMVGTTNTYEPMHRHKAMPASTSQGISQQGYYTDAIKTFTTDGFTVGIRDTVNLNGRTYWYIAQRGSQ